MNERVKELAEQAGADYGSYDPLGLFDETKFAELIVQKCASIVYNTCEDGDAGAMAILYEFDIDGTRSQK